jgi:hypothetical protein
MIAAMLSFDMVGSPHFVRFVNDGDLSDSAPPQGGAPPASAEIEELFLDSFESQGLETEPPARRAKRVVQGTDCDTSNPTRYAGLAHRANRAQTDCGLEIIVRARRGPNYVLPSCGRQGGVGNHHGQDPG